MNDQPSARMTQHLRKRQVVIVGHGTSVVAFCHRFKSNWAEVTVVTSESEYAPMVVRHGIASGHLKSGTFSRLLRIRFGNRKNLRFLNDRVANIDTENRQLKLENSDSPLIYDYLLIGNQTQSASSDEYSTALNTIADANRWFASLKQRSTSEVLVIGSDVKSIDLVSTLSKSDPKTSGVLHSGRVMLDCESGIQFENRTLIGKDYSNIIRRIRRESILVPENETRDQLKNDVIRVRSFKAKYEKWTSVLFEQNGESQQLSKLIKPNLQMRKYQRIFLLPEIVQTKDSLGKQIPSDDNAWMQQGYYLARILSGLIEVKRGYETDCPGFLFSDGLKFVTLKKWNSVGFAGSRIFSGWFAFLLDVIFVKYPIFKLTYGVSEGFSKLRQWLRYCK